MFVKQVRLVARDLDRCLADVEPQVLGRPEAADLLEELVGIERRVAAVRGQVAKRAEETNAWIGSGRRSPQACLAGVIGTSVGEAKRTLETVDALDELPVVAEAFATGAVSEAQARQIAATGKAATGHERELVERAGKGNFRQLKDRCRELEAQAESATEERARLSRMHERRATRWWTEPDGAQVMQTRFGPEQGPVARAHNDAELDAIFRLRRSGGSRESLAA